MPIDGVYRAGRLLTILVDRDRFGPAPRVAQGISVRNEVAQPPTLGLERAVELAARYSWLDLSNDGIRGGTLAEWSFAINWVLFSNLRMSNNFVLSQTADRAPTVAEPVAESGIAYSWVTRFQIDF